MGVGQQIGDYRIVDEIGAGGMGNVFLARHVHLRKDYALKVLPDELSDDPAFVARFHDEARVMADLRHPNIVQVHNMSSQEGTFFLAMDYVTGANGRPESLRDYLRARPDGRADPRQVRKWAVQIVEALGYAHQRGIVHRDIKPGNILLDARGDVLLADFGLAKAIGSDFILSQIHKSSDGSLSVAATIGSGADGRSGEAAKEDLSFADTASAGQQAVKGSGASGVLGTYDYMAPEQRGEGSGRIDPRTDIYAVGVLLYRMLTGRRPVGAVAPPSEVVRGLARDWDVITRRCLAYAPEDRYPSATVLLAALRATDARGTDSPATAQPPPVPRRSPGASASAPPGALGPSLGLKTRVFTCTNCGNRFEAFRVKTLPPSAVQPTYRHPALGFPKARCLECGHVFFYPLSARARWLFYIVAGFLVFGIVGSLRSGTTISAMVGLLTLFSVGVSVRDYALRVRLGRKGISPE